MHKSVIQSEDTHTYTREKRKRNARRISRRRMSDVTARVSRVACLECYAAGFGLIITRLTSGRRVNQPRTREIVGADRARARARATSWMLDSAREILPLYPFAARPRLAGARIMRPPPPPLPPVAAGLM